MRFCAATVIGAVATITPGAALAASRVTVRFDSGWRFLKSDPRGAERPEFDDRAWRALSVPHDWNVDGSFGPQSAAGEGGILPAAVGWYRKRFTLAAEYASRRVFVDFDGVTANSEVWINGIRLGKRPYRYSGFRCDLTGHVKFGDESFNVLAVRADNFGQPASAAGISRHVWLMVTSPVYLDHRATYVSTPAVSSREATVRIESTVSNQSTTPREVSLAITILAPDGSTVRNADTPSETIAPGESVDFVEDLFVIRPDRWSPTHPAIYRALVVARADQEAMDDEMVSFGIREFRLDATGSWLNGRNFKMHGVAVDDNGGALGAAVPLRVWERRLQTLQEIGVNAIRMAHNPPALEFLNLCHRMGFLVMEEAPQAEARDAMRRDRSDPSVIAYGAGNEWPAVVAVSALLDQTGGKQPLAYERQSWWSDQPMVRIARRVAHDGIETVFSDWTPAEAPPHEESIEVYSNCEEVELTINGRSLATQSLPADSAPRTWRVPFEAGTLTALGKNKGQVVATHELRTAGNAAKIVLTTDRTRLAAEWDDVSYVTAIITDENGVTVPGSSDTIEFKISGPGWIVAVDSADIASHEPFQASTRRAYQGECLAIVKARAAGEIVVSASASGLAGAMVTIEGR